MYKNRKKFCKNMHAECAQFAYSQSYACSIWESSIIVAIIVGHGAGWSYHGYVRTIVALMAEQMLIYWVKTSDVFAKKVASVKMAAPSRAFEPKELREPE